MTLILFILMLGVIVLIHEAGHFFWAKKCGVYCYEFSIGFGPKLFSFHRKNDETTYSFRLIPIGGYVSMAGEEADDDKSIKNKQKLCNKPWYQKLIIVLAGVINNFILAFVVLFLIGLIYGSYETKPIVGTIVKGSASSKSELRVGDQILRLNGKKTKTWDDLTLALNLENNNKTQEFLVKGKDGKERIVNIKPDMNKDKDGNVTYSYGFGMNSKKKHGFVNALKYSTSKFGSMFSSMFVTIKALVTGKVGMNALSGPVGIYNIVGESRKAGFDNVLYLLAYLSVNIGFINLIPFPAFDGYRAFITVIEAVSGKKVNQKVDAIVNNVGLLLLFGLMIYITVKDILRFF